MNEIRVRVVRRSGRHNLVLRWTDLKTGLGCEKTAATTNRRAAERQAALLAKELAEAEELAEEVPWIAFRERFEHEVLALQSTKSLRSWKTAANQFERMIGPETLQDATSGALSRFKSRLYEQGLSLSTIAAYLRELRRGLRWAAEIWDGYEPPAIRFPRIPKHDLMKGRPITAEEVERMLANTPKVVGPKVAPSWTFLLRGLWFSALRLSEALNLWWTREDRLHVWGIDHKQPMLRILAESEKGRRDRLLPIIPEFAHFLWSVPSEKRAGRVFGPELSRGPTTCMETVSATICSIGEAAKIKVGANRKGKIKYASAQDLRRGFGFRLAPKIHPMQLRELMRHESLDTTMRYYIGVNAVRTAQDVWQALESDGNTESGDQTGDMLSGSIPGI